MRNIILWFGLISFTCVSYAQVKEYVITSNIQDLQDSTFSMTIWDGGTQARYAEGSMRDGQIYYRDTTSSPLVIRITLSKEELFKFTGKGFFPVKSQSIWLIASPGKTIHLSGFLSDFAEVYPSGDRENEIISELNRVYHPLLNAAVNISVELALNGDNMDSLRRQELEDEQKLINSQAKECMHNFLRKHSSSIAGLYYLNDMLLRSVFSVEEAEELLSTVAEEYLNTPYYHTVSNRIAGSKYDIGQQMFDIVSSNTYDGNIFSTSSWKGKFYLIDFWGSWCVPCIEDVPSLKELRDTHSTRLEVLGIASDREQPWRQAIVKHDLNWVQILNGNLDQDFVSRLNVTGFPTKILVDPNGKIVYRSSGGGKSSFEKMEEIINNWKD